MDKVHVVSPSGQAPVLYVTLSPCAKKACLTYSRKITIYSLSGHESPTPSVIEYLTVVMSSKRELTAPSVIHKDKLISVSKRRNILGWAIDEEQAMCKLLHKSSVDITRILSSSELCIAIFGNGSISSVFDLDSQVELLSAEIVVADASLVSTESGSRLLLHCKKDHDAFLYLIAVSDEINNSKVLSLTSIDPQSEIIPFSPLSNSHVLLNAEGKIYVFNPSDSTVSRSHIHDKVVACPRRDYIIEERNDILHLTYVPLNHHMGSCDIRPNLICTNEYHSVIVDVEGRVIFLRHSSIDSLSIAKLASWEADQQGAIKNQAIVTFGDGKSVLGSLISCSREDLPIQAAKLVLDDRKQTLCQLRSIEPDKIIQLFQLCVQIYINDALSDDQKLAILDILDLILTVHYETIVERVKRGRCLQLKTDLVDANRILKSQLKRVELLSKLDQIGTHLVRNKQPISDAPFSVHVLDI